MTDQRSKLDTNDTQPPAQNVPDETIDQLSSATVYDSAGEKVGGVGKVYLGDNSGRPSWVSVKTGLFGTRETIVPMSDARLDGDKIHVPYTKDVIKDAPNVEAGEHLSPREEQELHAHYGQHGFAGHGGERTDSDTDGVVPAGAGDQSPDALRHEGDRRHKHEAREADYEHHDREHHEHHDRYADQAERAKDREGVAGQVSREPENTEQQADRDLKLGTDRQVSGADDSDFGAAAGTTSPRGGQTADSQSNEGQHDGGRRISDYDEVVDGGYGIGSAAPIHDRAQPLGHPVRAWRDTMSFNSGKESEASGEREPDVWFFDEQAAYNAGYHPAD